MLPLCCSRLCTVCSLVSVALLVVFSNWLGQANFAPLCHKIYTLQPWWYNIRSTPAYDLKCTDVIFSGVGSVGRQYFKKEILLADRTLLLDRCSKKSPIIAEVPERGGSWPALWDTVRHLGFCHTVGLQHLSRMLAHHGNGSKPCPLCDEQLSGDSLTSHVFMLHKNEIGLPHLTLESLLTQLVERDVLLA